MRESLTFETHCDCQAPTVPRKSRNPRTRRRHDGATTYHQKRPCIPSRQIAIIHHRLTPICRKARSSSVSKLMSFFYFGSPGPPACDL
jgi:hypothetical protein